jgi:hypothetical protein
MRTSAVLRPPGVLLWCRVTLVDPEGNALAAGVLEGPTAPDIGAVDDVARLALLANRMGGGLVLTDVSADLRTLVELTGLAVEMEREPERGEQALGVHQVEEERHARDLPA